MKRIRYVWLLLLACALCPNELRSSGTPQAQSGAPTAPDSTDPKAQVRAVLEAQRTAWNRHDLRAYMQCYWNSPELTFFGGDAAATGWENTYERYRAAYQAPGREMGRLEWSDIRIELLAPDAAFATGSWHLALKNGSRRQGMFTVILRKFGNNWYIIHDHSS
jgi:ketosteroid isomerase-like protein